MFKKISTIIIFFLTITVGLSAMYYFIIYCPALDERRWLSEQKERCAMNAQDFYDKIIDDADVFELGYEYYYNPELNRCLLNYSYAYGDTITHYVKDIYTNEDLLFYSIGDSGEWDISYDEFEARKKELFNKD